MVAVRQPSRVNHQSCVHGVEGLDHPRVREGPLDPFPQAFGVDRVQDRRHSLRKVERVGNVQQDLPGQVGTPGGSKGRERRSTIGGIDHHFAFFRCCAERLQPDALVRRLPLVEWLPAHGARLSTAGSLRRIPGSHHHFMPQGAEGCGERPAHSAGSKDCDLHDFSCSPDPCLLIHERTFAGWRRKGRQPLRMPRNEPGQVPVVAGRRDWKES